MKKKILFSLLGGLIIFAWMFLSWAIPNFHKSGITYTPQQGEILQKLNELGLKEGTYLLGQADPSASQEEQGKQNKELEGKSWAVVSYHETMTMEMLMPMVRGLLVCFVISYLLFWMFLQQKEPKLMNRIFLALAVGLIGFFYFPYTNFIWFEGPGIFAYFADGIVPWLILGFIGHKMAKTNA